MADATQLASRTMSAAGPSPAKATQTMRAVAVVPGKPNSLHLAVLPKPELEDVPGGRGVLVRLLRVGVDGTDKEINAAEYGAPPPGYDFLVVGHESFGRVEAVGPRVTELAPGDYEARLTIKPLEFDRFESPGPAKDNWPLDERPADQKPVELQATFTVISF